MSMSQLGSIAELRRYPVKSMQGESITETFIAERGLLGDRAYAILDRTTGHIASAKHSRKWGRLVACHAAYVAPPHPNQPLPPVSITPPDGAVVSSEQPDVDQVLSQLLEREVSLVITPPAAPTREANRAEVEAMTTGAEDIRVEPLAYASPTGTFFDYAPVHLLTTATLQQFHLLYPAGNFDRRRFRPNVLVASFGDEMGFIENGWLGHTVIIGDEAQLHLIDPCPRCVVITHAVGELPRDLGILRTVTQHNAAASVTLAPGVVMQAVAGVYGRTQQDGLIRVGDSVRAAL